jgi:alpha-N-arabinofuranosidase
MQGPDLVNNEQNRNLARWHNWPGCDLELDNSAPTLTSALPYQMSVSVPAGGTGTTGMWNEGFAGFNVTTTTRYSASFWLRGNFQYVKLCPCFHKSLGAELFGNSIREFGSSIVGDFS